MTEVISILIPAFNESGRIAAAISRIADYCACCGLTGEIIVVDDGSRDATVEEAEGAPHGHMELKVLRQPVNCGKGAAIRVGVLAARGTILLFTDADLSVPMEEFAKLLGPLRKGALVVIGSRRLRGSPLWRYVPGGHNGVRPSSVKVHQPFHREALGEVYHWLVGMFLGVRIKDVNCGFKCFRSDVARHLFGLMMIERWGFDAEILLIAQRQGIRVEEVEVDWYNNPLSKVNVLTAPFSSLIEVFRIKMNDLRGRYSVGTRQAGEVARDLSQDRSGKGGTHHRPIATGVAGTPDA